MYSGNSNHLDHVEQLYLLDVSKQDVPRQRGHKVKEEHALEVVQRNGTPVHHFLAVFVANGRVEDHEHIQKEDYIRQVVHSPIHARLPPRWRKRDRRGNQNCVEDSPCKHEAVPVTAPVISLAKDLQGALMD